MPLSVSSAVNSQQNSASSASRAVTLASHVAGDLLLVEISYSANTTNGITAYTSGWTLVKDDFQGASGTTRERSAVFVKIAESSAETFAFTPAAAGRSAHQARTVTGHAVVGAGDVRVSSAKGASTAITTPEITGLNAGTTYGVVTIGAMDTPTSAPTAAPSGYSWVGAYSTTEQTAAGSVIFDALRTFTGSTAFTPGTFTAAVSGNWLATTLMVPETANSGPKQGSSSGSGSWDVVASSGRKISKGQSSSQISTTPPSSEEWNPSWGEGSWFEGGGAIGKRPAYSASSGGVSWSASPREGRKSPQGSSISNASFETSSTGVSPAPAYRSGSSSGQSSWSSSASGRRRPNASSGADAVWSSTASGKRFPKGEVWKTDRRNYFNDPFPVSFLPAQAGRFANSRWGSDGVYSIVTGQTDGPAGYESVNVAQFHVTNLGRNSHGFHLAENVESPTPNPTFMVPVTPGETITVSAYARVLGKPTVPWQLRYRFANGSTPVGAAVGATASTPNASGWARPTFTVTIPDGVTHMAINLQFTGGYTSVIGDKLQATGGLIERSSTVGTVFAGDSSVPVGQRARWLGPANQSSSVLETPSLVQISSPGAVGSRTPSGSASGSWSTSDALQIGKRSPRGSSTVSGVFAGAAIGSRPLVPVAQGSASGSNSWISPATVAKVARKANSVSTWTVTSTPVSGKKTSKSSNVSSSSWIGSVVSGKRRPKGSSSVDCVWSGYAISGSGRAGQSTALSSWTGSSVGGRSSLSESVSSTVFSAVAAGKINSRGIAFGGASSWSGDAESSSKNKGSAGSTAVYSGSASGKRRPKGNSSPEASWGSAAQGRKKQSGSATSSCVWSSLQAVGGRKPFSESISDGSSWLGSSVGLKYSSGSIVGAAEAFWEGQVFATTPRRGEIASELSFPLLYTFGFRRSRSTMLFGQVQFADLEIYGERTNRAIAGEIDLIELTSKLSLKELT